MGKEKPKIIRSKKAKTEKEIKQLAYDIFKGLVFTNAHCKDIDLIPIVFAPLSFMDRKMIKAFEKEKPALFYEYMDKALPKSINGYPVFGSMRYLSEAELDILRKYLVELNKDSNESEKPKED